ncbi:TonB-dependent siderophore receptor [Glaciecola sp. HTCC2999]|uniref:TonB-dependent receptor plug domain-containing protein n=1 Tax=Glaciecola sp. HTCC2999 TaxID=455436 RepID=UPI0000E11837|nr:TonB-dependent receptor [Glaciecola sp. HTCC2999]
MFTNTKLAKSIQLAIAFGAVSGLSLSTAAVAQETEEAEAEAVEKIQVTGSRIKRADMEGALPVTVIDRAAIEFSGQTSVADLLRNTSFNSSGSFRPQSGSSAQGVSQISLRGLGASRSLVLVDGRRLARSPSTGSSQDLNNIPAAAVERVEILTDGASAVYGSDAIGGVINIITRKDFNGVEMKLGAGQIEHENGDREEGSIIFGASSGEGQILGGVSWNKRDIIFARDFPWYDSGNAVSVNSNNFENIPLTTRTAVPGGCNENSAYSLTDFGAALPNTAGEQKLCLYEFGQVSADEASTGNVALFLNARYEINDDWSVFSNMNVSKTNSFGRYAPSLARIRVSADSPNNPTNPTLSDGSVNPLYDSAFGAAIGGDNQDVNVRHRFAALGTRDGDVENTTSDLLVGFEGDIDGILVDFGVRRNLSKTFDIGRNYVVTPIATEYFNSGRYDIRNPLENSADTLNSMKATISRVGEYNTDEVFGSVQFDLFEMDGGTAVAIVGGEWRDIFYRDQYDSLSEGGAIGGSAGNSAGGGRQASAAYVEAVFPYSDELEITTALRRDKYSDYGSDVSPKVSVRYNPTDELVIRGSYGEGFRAPTIDILTQQPSFSADSVSDVDTCRSIGQDDDCSTQIDATVIANPGLESESSSQYAIGVAYEAADWIDFSIDYFNIEIENRIRGFSSQFIIDSVRAGDSIPSDFSVVRNAATNAVESVTRGFGNDGTLETDGLDFNINTRFDFNEIGSLNQNLTFTYTNNLSTDGGRNFVDDAGTPEYRGVFSNVYSIGDFDIVWNMNVIASTSEDTVDGEQIGHIPSWITNDLQVNYNAPWGGKVSVGSQNIGGKQPPLFAFGGRDYNFNLYDGYGRYVYARYTQSF